MPDDSTHGRQTTNPSDADRDATEAARDERENARGASDEYVGEYDKLVRDDIPAVVSDDGNQPVTRTVDGAEYDRYLAAKLVEEATEYADALGDDGAPSAEDAGDEDPGGEDALDELADAYAVLDAIVAASATTMDDVRERAREKAAERGGFEDGIVLERIESDETADAGRDEDES